MSKPSYICNCDVIHEDIVNDVKSKMQPKDDYIQLASLFKLFGDGTRVDIWCLSPAKKYKLYKSSINKSIHFVQRNLSSRTKKSAW